MGQQPQEVPRAVAYWAMCKRFKCLPYPGGLLDQPPWVVEAFMICESAERNAAEHQAKKKGAKGARSGRKG